MTPFGYTVLGFGSGITGGPTFAFGDEQVYSSASTSDNTMAFDRQTPNVFVIGYRASGNAYAQVGTIGAGGAISYGTAVVTQSGGTMGTVEIAFDASTAGRFVINYTTGTRHNSGTANWRIGQISNGDEITFGSVETMPHGNAYPNSQWHAAADDCAFTADGTKVFYAGYDQGSANEGRWSYLSASGTTLSSWTYGASHDSNGRAQQLTAALDDTDTVWLMYCSNSANLMVRRIQASGQGGTNEVTTNGGSGESHDIAVNPNSTGKFVIAYQDQANSNYGTVRIGVATGDSVSYGTAVVFSSVETTNIRVAFDIGAAIHQFIIMYTVDDSGAKGRGRICIANADNTVTLGAEHGGASGVSSINGDDVKDRGSFDFDHNNAGTFVYTYRDNGNSDYGTARVGSLG